jgi:thiol-disulfide isomerase/thioredoxin
MRPILFAGIALLIGCPQFTVGDDPKEAPRGPVARKFAELKKKFEAEEKELKKKLADASDPDDQKQISFSLKELSAITASDAIELAVDNPKDEASIDSAVFALKLLGQFKVTGRDMDKAVAFILDNHINSPKIQGALAQMSGAGATGQQFLKTVAEKTTNKEVQGLAMFYCAVALDGQAAAQEAQGNEEAAMKMRAEATEMMEKAVKLAPDAKVGSDTLTKAVATEMISMRIGVGNPIPEVEGFDLDGKKVKMSSFKGKVVLFDFWATWCGPCVRMIPHERQLFEKLSKKGFVLLSVNVDEEKSTLTEFLVKEKMPWSHWWDGRQGPISKMFRIQAFPTLYLIDAKGIVRKKWIGSPGEETLDKAVEDLVAEAEKASR